MPQLEKKTVAHTCPKHGEMQVEVFKIFKDFGPASCTTCKAETEAQHAADEAARKNREQGARDKAALEARLKGSLIPPRFQQKHFGNYRPATAEAKAIFESCRRYAEDFPARLESGSSMILCGPAGTGKTHLACAIGNHIIHHHAKSAVYMQVSAAIRMVKETYSKGSERTEQDAINWFKKPALFILDEVGVQFGTDAERFILFEIINARYEDMKPTLLLSNLAMEGLIQYAGERVIDRMKENGGKLLPFVWQSHRGVENLATP